jgi:hypothetical protein
VATPWSVRDGSGWNIGDSPTATADPSASTTHSGEATVFFDRDANPIAERSQDPKPYAFTDWLAYDVEHGVEHKRRARSQAVVRLHARVGRRSAAGESHDR